MKHDRLLTVTSLLSILLLTLHITDDIVRGISKVEPSNTALAVLVIFLYGTLVLTERRSGYVIMLLVGLFAAAMPVIHMRGVHYAEIARSPGGFFFVDGASVLYLVGSTMDWQEDDFTSGFVFENPNAKGACGCGESFTV